MKDECKYINQFIKDIKDKGLTNQQVARAIMELLNCKEEDNKLKSFSDDELKQELDRRQNACK